MPITKEQSENAQAIQEAAAQDLNGAVRLVAGPGTGKSYVIERRVEWLLSDQNVSPKCVIAVSFTRAAAKDLRDRINKFGTVTGQLNVDEVRVSTLHSLALHILRQTGSLNYYPADPNIMDDWELSKIFDAEFAENTKLLPTRCAEIRRDHEAYWSTGTWEPPNSPVLEKPITEIVRNHFRTFYSSRTQSYSCILPGDIVRTCVTQIKGGFVDPVDILGLEHLIVDEVQDLNASDFEFIHELISRGVKVFICGDDDQSVYSFRFAFTHRHGAYQAVALLPVVKI